MEEVLHNILIHTYNADPLLRGQAEVALKQFIISEGAVFALLSFLGNKTIHRDLRQAAAIIIKNKIFELWRTVPGDEEHEKVLLTPTDKDQAKSMLIETLLAETDNSIRGLIAEAVKSIAEVDYPERYRYFPSI